MHKCDTFQAKRHCCKKKITMRQVAAAAVNTLAAD